MLCWLYRWPFDFSLFLLSPPSLSLCLSLTHINTHTHTLQEKSASSSSTKIFGKSDLKLLEKQLWFVCLDRLKFFFFFKLEKCGSVHTHWKITLVAHRRMGSHLLTTVGTALAFSTLISHNPQLVSMKQLFLFSMCFREDMSSPRLACQVMEVGSESSYSSSQRRGSK